MSSVADKNATNGKTLGATDAREEVGARKKVDGANNAAVVNETSDANIAAAGETVVNGDASLAKRLFEEPYRFDFFQAVRLFERVYKERAAVGRAGVAPTSETVRFRTRPSIAFPPSQIYSIARSADAEDSKLAKPSEMFVTFFGLTGALGVLPAQYTELLIERARYKDTALWEFFDLINHRLLSLFYRAWEKHHFPVAYETAREDRFTEYLFDLVGMGTRGLRDERAARLDTPDQALIFYGGHVAQRPHSASAISQLLADHFGVKANVEQFTGQWLKLDAGGLTKLGAQNSALGMTTIAGARVWNDQSKFRIVLGALTLKEFQTFVPSGTAFSPLTKVLRFLVGTELDFDVQLVLKAAEVPNCIMTTRARRKPLLGWTTWLKTKPFMHDDAQVVLQTNN